MKPPKARKHEPDTELRKLSKQQGGKARDDAVTAANSRVEAMREGSIEAIDLTLDSIEALVAKSPKEALSAEQLAEVLELVDRIITLAGTFGFTELDQIARSLADLTNLLLAKAIGPAEPIRVHVRAARLFAPRAQGRAATDAGKVLAELHKVLEHFGAAPAGAKP
jgi:hypothetical protein